MLQATKVRLPRAFLPLFPEEIREQQAGGAGGEREKAADFGLCRLGWPRGRTSARREVLPAGDRHPRPQGRGRAPPPAQAPATEPLLHRDPRGPPSGQGGSAAAGGLLVPLPAGLGGRLRILPRPLRTVRSHRGTARKFRGTVGPHRRAQGKAGLGRGRFDTSPGVAPVSPAVSRRGAGSCRQGGDGAGRRLKGKSSPPPLPPGVCVSVLPREGKARRRHPWGWLRWWCPSGRAAGGAAGRAAGSLRSLLPGGSPAAGDGGQGPRAKGWRGLRACGRRGRDQPAEVVVCLIAFSVYRN